MIPRNCLRKVPSWCTLGNVNKAIKVQTVTEKITYLREETSSFAGQYLKPPIKTSLAPESKNSFSVAPQGYLAPAWQGLEPKEILHPRFEQVTEVDKP